MGVDVVDVGRGEVGELYCPRHRVPGALAVGIRRHHVEAVRGDAGPHQPGQDVGAARFGVLLGLDDHQRPAFAEDETVAVLVERAAGAGRVVVGGRHHDAHRGECGDRHRLDPGLDATADRDVGFAEHNLLPGPRDALRAGCAGRHRGHHPGLGVPFQPDRRRSAVGHVHLHGQRVDGLHAARAHVVVPEDHLLGGTHAGPDRYRQPVGVHLGRSRVIPHSAAQHGGHLLQVAHPAVLDPRELAVEFFDEVPTDADRQVELLDERVVERADTALAFEQQLPGVLHVGSQGSRHGNARDDHVGETLPRSQR